MMIKTAGIRNFNVRVYGIVINNQNELLVSHEVYREKKLTKFVGGGLEKGEGLKDALIREFDEELQEEIQVGQLFYINDFFQQSAFVPSDQILSVFYFVSPLNYASFLSKTEIGFRDQTFSWLPLKEVRGDEFTFDIENLVVGLLKNKA